MPYRHLPPCPTLRAPTLRTPAGAPAQRVRHVAAHSAEPMVRCGSDSTGLAGLNLRQFAPRRLPTLLYSREGRARSARRLWRFIRGRVVRLKQIWSLGHRPLHGPGRGSVGARTIRLTIQKGQTDGFAHLVLQLRLKSSQIVGDRTVAAFVGHPEIVK
jgi:hypothetical protein